jgi:SRSO17 transposase
MSRVASKGRNLGDIVQLVPTEYLEYIGNGLTRVVKGRLAEMTWKHPTLFRHLRKAGHFYSKKVLGSLPEMADGLAASLEGKIYRDTYAGLAALYLPDARSDEADSRPEYKRWAGVIVPQS